MRLGTKRDQIRTYVAGISGRTVSGTGQTVVVNAQGQLGTASAARQAATAALEATARCCLEGSRSIQLSYRGSGLIMAWPCDGYGGTGRVIPESTD